MRLSRIGILIIISSIILVGANCASINRLLVKRNLVDGSTAYKERQLPQAEAFFRKAVSYDPEAKTEDGKLARLFLARIVLSQFNGNRSQTFSDNDFTNISGFSTKLSAKADPVSEYLYSKTSPETQQLLGQYNADNKNVENRKNYLASLVKDLNKVIIGESIYDQTRFGKVTLSNFTKDYMAQEPKGDQIPRFNRLLLEDAYPEIAKKPQPEESIKLYRGVLTDEVNDQKAFEELIYIYVIQGGLYEEEREKWRLEWEKAMTERAENSNVEPRFRADAYASLASRQYSCASDISNADTVKKTVKKDGKDDYQYVKPENPEEYTKFTQCVQKGVEFIDKAVALENDEAKNSKNVVVEPLSTEELAKLEKTAVIFSKVWSFKSSLMRQSARWAEMDGRTADIEAFKTKIEEGRVRYLEYAQIVTKLETEKERRKPKDSTTANTNANNANTNK